VRGAIDPRFEVGRATMAGVADADAETGWPALARHEVAVATVRAFAERSGAERVVVLLDEGQSEPATMLECGADGAVALTAGERVYVLPPEAGAGATPVAFHSVRPAPATALRADPATGELTAPVGAIANLAGAVMSLARGLGGRSVASADFATADAGRPLTIAARAGEPIVVAVGDDQFTLPDGWTDATPSG
jgi:hypothetical protein